MTSISTLKIATLLVLFVCSKLSAQKSSAPRSNIEIQIIDGIEYEILPGLAEITSINKVKIADSSDLDYDEYKVLFNFVPMEGDEVLEILKEKPLEFNLLYRGFAVSVGPAYLKKMQVRKGRRYSMKLFQSRSRGVNIRRFFFESKALENHLFQAYDDVVDGLISIIDILGEDSVAVLKNDSTLSDAQKRILIDVEYVYKGGQFGRPILNRHVVDYLEKHNQLLKEYESAKTVFSNMAEEQRLKEKLIAKKKEKSDSIKRAQQVFENKTVSSVVRKTRIVRGCYYEVLPGLAEITAINLLTAKTDSERNYDEYEVLFKFLPQEGHELLEAFNTTELEFVLYHRGERILVGPDYLKKKQVRVGNQFQMTFFQKRNAEVCSEQYTFESKGLDNDLFEAFPPKLIPKVSKDKVAVSDTTNTGPPKVLPVQKPEQEAAKVDVEVLYEQALQALEAAKTNRKKMRKANNETIKAAKLKVRSLKKLKKLL